MATETAKRRTCTDHCATCGRHFHGLKAFDAHRRDFQCLDPAAATSDRARQLLQVWTDDGWCDLERGCYQDGVRVRSAHPVTVWQPRTGEAERERLLRVRRKRQRAPGAPAGVSAHPAPPATATRALQGVLPLVAGQPS